VTASIGSENDGQLTRSLIIALPDSERHPNFANQELSPWPAAQTNPVPVLQDILLEKQ
jgi:hypothetical protein